jgi:hypothetical protein
MDHHISKILINKSSTTSNEDNPLPVSLFITTKLSKHPKIS